MSGGVSVPFAYWGLFQAPDDQKLIFLFLALLCFFIAAYLVWKKERDRVCDLEALLDPKLQLTFDPNHLAFVHETNWNVSQVLVIHVLPTCKSPVDNVSGFLNSIHRLNDKAEWEPTQFNEAIPLTWSYPNTKEPLTLYPKPDKYLNAFFVFENPFQIVPGVWELTYPKRMHGILNANDVYKINICVTGAAHAFAEIYLKLQIGNQWNKPKILEIMQP